MSDLEAKARAAISATGSASRGEWPRLPKRFTVAGPVYNETWSLPEADLDFMEAASPQAVVDLYERIETLENQLCEAAFRE